MGRAEGAIETEPWSHNQPSIIFFGLLLWHFLALKSWFQEEARMWKSVPQVRQAHILSTWSQDFLTDWWLFADASTDWSHGEKSHAEVFQQLAKHEPPLQCESFEVHGCLSCKLIKQGTSQRFSKETCTPRDILDFAYVRNDFDVLTMLIDHWEPERRKTFQQVLAKHIPYSVIYSRSSSEVEIHLHIVSPRSTFGIFMTQEPTEGFKRWSNGLWDGIGASWCQWSDPMGVENWHDQIQWVFQEEKPDIFHCKWSQLKVETAVRITVTTSWWCEAQWWHHVQILERRQLAKLQQGGIIVWHLVYVHIMFIYDYVGMGVYIPLSQTFGHRYFIGCA